MFHSQLEIMKICSDLNISEEIYHSIQLQVCGICKYEDINTITLNQNIGFKEIHLRLPINEMNGQYSVPRKLPIMPIEQSPYIYKDNHIFYEDQPIFQNESIIEVPLPKNNEPRYLKGFSFPFLGTEQPFFELRINPKNTGKCPGRCLFCHREFSHRSKPDKSNRFMTPKEVVDAIHRKYNKDIFKKVSHIAFISELFGNEDKLLVFLEELKRLLIESGAPVDVKFGTIAQDIRTEQSLKRLYEIVTEKRYSFTLEMFTNRKIIMGGYKGISMENVEQILQNARKVGFKEIKLNYIAGIDSFSSFEKGIKELRNKNLIDSIGLSILTAFFPNQLKLRHNEAWSVDYYIKVVKIIKDLGIEFYKSNCFEMGYPLPILQ